jgi:hypothetical protein
MVKSILRNSPRVDIKRVQTQTPVSAALIFFNLWDRLFPQAETTLNLLRKSRHHPQLSAAAYYHGTVDYNKNNFAPPGCNIIAHEKSSQ